MTMLRVLILVTVSTLIDRPAPTSAQVSPSHSEPGSPRLELELTHSVRVPVDLQITGLAPGPNNSTLAWSTSTGWVALISGDGTVVPLASGQLTRPIAATFLDGNTIEVVEEAGVRVRVDLTTQAIVESHPILTVVDAIATAAWAEGGWFVAGQRSSDGVWLVHREGVKGDSGLLELPEDMAGSLGFRIVGFGAGVVATAVEFPFPSRVWIPGEAAVSIDLPDEAVPESLRGRELFSMGALRVDPGWLQVLFDPRSDARIFVTFGEDGQMLRVAEVQVAIGFFAAGWEKGTLLGMRDTGDNAREVVIYTWRWAT